MDRLFEDRFVRPRSFGFAGEGTVALPLDITDSADALEVDAALPGMRPEDVDITVEDGTLTIRAESRSERQTTEGEVLIAGRDIAKLSGSKVPHLRRRIGTVFQDFKLLTSRSVYDNVAYALQVIGASRSEIRKKVPDALRLVGLADKVSNLPDQLSGGEQQRLSVARAFVNHPPLLLADEPTGNLDPSTSIGIMQTLYRINRTGTTVVVVTHDREMVDKMRRRVIALDAGRVVRDQSAGMYTADDESTSEFASRLRNEMDIGDEEPRY